MGKAEICGCIVPKKKKHWYRDSVVNLLGNLLSKNLVQYNYQ